MELELPYSKKKRDVLKDVLNDYNIPQPEHIRKQRLWRKNQKSIFYETGRPIFDNFKNKNHIFCKLNNGKYVGYLSR
jgi:hypothetical protein